jgi:hypothetical protein
MAVEDDRKRKGASTVPTSKLAEISGEITKLATAQQTTRDDILKPLVSDMREVRDTSRSTDQAFRIHLKECEKFDEQVKEFPKLSTVVDSHTRSGKLMVAVAMLLFIPIISALVYSVRSEATMRSDVSLNATNNIKFQKRFEDHTAKQSIDMDSIMDAIDEVPGEVAIKVNGHDKMTDGDIEELVSKLPSLYERRRARALLRKIRAKTQE